MNKTGQRGPAMDAKERDAIIDAYKAGEPVNSDRGKSTLDKLEKIARRELRKELNLPARAPVGRNRNRLAVTKLPEFVGWAVDNGWHMAEPKGAYEVIRLTKRGRPVVIVHRREHNNNGTHLTHLTTYGESEKLRREWMDWRMANEAATLSIAAENRSDKV